MLKTGILQIDNQWTTHLTVEKAIDESNKKSLKRAQEVGAVAP